MADDTNRWQRDRDWDDRDRDEQRRRYRDHGYPGGGSTFGGERDRDAERARYGGSDDYGRSGSRDYDRPGGTGGDWQRDRDYGQGRSYGQGRDYGQGRSYGEDRDYRPVGGGGYGQGLGYRGDDDYGRRGSGSRGYGDRDNLNVTGYRGERGFVERAGDEIASWFGGDDAARRREQDARRGDEGAQHHRGRGPQGYRRSDERIRDDVSDRLTDDAYVDASNITVNVSGGEVTLEGTVDSRQSRRRAEDVAEAVSGVSHVQNNLRVGQTGMGSTGSITTGGRSTASAPGSLGSSGMEPTGSTSGSTGMASTSSTSGLGSTGTGAGLGSTGARSTSATDTSTLSSIRAEEKR